MRLVLLVPLLGTLLGAPALSAQARTDTTIVIGFTTRLRSEILKEDRPVSVYLPQSLQQGAAGGARYPVVYLLDGDAHFHHATGVVNFLAANGRIPEMIVVAVPNTQRTRDLTPRARADSAVMTTTTGQQQVARFPGQGGADAFLRFLSEELAPWVEARYPTAPYRVLVGHSFGGLFAVHAALRKPESFNAYIAVSPSLWWDEGRLVSDAPAAVAAVPGERFLYMTMGAEGPNMLEPIEQLADVLRQSAPATFRWRYQPLANDNHGTTPHRTLYDGLEALFEGWEAPQEVIAAGDVARIDAHFATLRARFGMPERTPEPILNFMGYGQLQQDPAKAVEIFRENARRFPESANVYDSLGDGLMATGDVAGALAQYERAVQLAESTGHQFLATYRTNLEAARKRLGGQKP